MTEKVEKKYYTYKDKETKLLNKDDPILVANISDQAIEWEERHFSHIMESTGKIMCYVDGCTSDLTSDEFEWEIWKPIESGNDHVDEPTANKKYMVYIKDQRGPKVIHDTLNEAEEELDRILSSFKVSDVEGYVLEIVKTKTTKVIITDKE